MRRRFVRDVSAYLRMAVQYRRLSLCIEHKPLRTPCLGVTIFLSLRYPLACLSMPKSTRSSGPHGYLHKPEDLTLYEYDGGVDKSRPDLVVFPQSTADVVAIVKLAAEL